MIFDCDGTLVDSEPISNRILSQSLNELGVKFTEERCTKEFLGLNWSDTIARIELLTRKPLPTGFQDNVTARRLTALKGSVKEMPGAGEAVQRILVSGYKVCVASSSEMPRIKINLEETGLSKYFGSNVFSATQVANGKPNPDLFLFSAERMGIPPGECAVVEDNMNGFNAGLAAGMPVFAYMPNNALPPMIDRVTTFNAFNDLPDLISKFA